MIIVNTETVPGYRVVRMLGVVEGNTVRAKHIGRDILAGLKNIVGGEISDYTELLTDARRTAVERMIAAGQSMGANAILNVRLATSTVAGGAAELMAYGTAAILEPEQGGPTSGRPT